jgi:protein TonB
LPVGAFKPAMQRSPLTLRDRAGAIAAVVLVHVGILLAMLSAGTVGLGEAEPDVPIETFDVIEPPQPPPQVVEEVKPEPRPRDEGEASPPNLKSQATPVVVPPPRVELPRPTPIVASETPGQGTQPTQGAAPVPGPGTGAGGAGTGTGSGGAGSGTGGGGGGEGTRPSVIPGTTLTSRDYPREVLRAWPRRARVFVAVRVQVDGRATNCRVDRSSGNPVVDQWTCQLVEQRVRFRPATDENGRATVSWYGYMQTPVNF